MIFDGTFSNKSSKKLLKSLNHNFNQELNGESDIDLGFNYFKLALQR